MSPLIALIVWLVCLVLLLYLDPAQSPDVSSALWVPVIWMSIVGSRLPSQWLGGQMGQVAAALQEGNPIDRAVYFGLILVAFVILAKRSFRWSEFFASNVALILFLSYALISVTWSDFPLIALKRWFRDFGNYLVILVVLTEQSPVEAVCILLRRVCYLLIPLSVILVKYYPETGKAWDSWTGVAQYAGVTTGKNMLGVLCLVSGVYFFWDTLARWPKRSEGRTKRIIYVNVAFIFMTLWLLTLSNSATSRVCLIVGCLVIAATHSGAIKKRPGILTTLIPIGICVYLVLAVGFGVDISKVVAEAVGRDATLTDRTKIWSVLLDMQQNPMLGTGYESFWLGSRLQWFWQNAGLGHINEAHNGFLEVYLNLGLAGVILLCGFLIASYQSIRKGVEFCSELGSLSLVLWLVLLFYSATEAAFRTGLMWVVFLLAAISVPESASSTGSIVQTSASTSDANASLGSLPSVAFENTAWGGTRTS
jgi:exopolysaccharide production protein ExoQ